MTLTTTYAGKIRDRVGQGDAALSADGAMDGTFNVSLPVGSGNRTVTSVDLLRTAGGEWDTIPNGFWALGAASSLDSALYNAPNATVNFAVADGGSFNMFASDSGSTYFNSGDSFTLTVSFADGSYGKGFVTLP